MRERASRLYRMVHEAVLAGAPRWRGGQSLTEMGQEYMLLRGRLMGFPSWQSLAVLIAVTSPPRSAQAEEARAAVRAALEQEAMAPSLPPVFPSRSRKEADPSRIARDQSEASANGAAAAAKSEAAARSAQGAALPRAALPGSVRRVHGGIPARRRGRCRLVRGRYPGEVAATGGCSGGL